MQQARNWRERILNHPHHAAVKSYASRQGFYVITDDGSGVHDRLPLAGITESLRENFWPNYTFKAAPKNVAGVPHNPLPRNVLPSINGATATRGPSGYGVSSDSLGYPVVNIKPIQPKMTHRARRLAAADRGTIVHEQVAQFIRYLVTSPDNCFDLFRAWLLTREEDVHPAARRIIQSFNEAMISEDGKGQATFIARFAPVWSEIVVCDLVGVQTGTAKPWATAIDALVYDTATGYLTVIEIKTSAAAFEEGSHAMSAPLQDRLDSPLGQGVVQTIVSMELLRRTFGDMPLMGMVLAVSPDGTRCKRHFIDPVDAKIVTDRLIASGWLGTGQTRIAEPKPKRTKPSPTTMTKTTPRVRKTTITHFRMPPRKK